MHWSEGNDWGSPPTDRTMTQRPISTRNTYLHGSQFGGGHHFHGLGDLLDRAHRLHAVLDCTHARSFTTQQRTNHHTKSGEKVMQTMMGKQDRSATLASRPEVCGCLTDCPHHTFHLSKNPRLRSAEPKTKPRHTQARPRHQHNPTHAIPCPSLPPHIHVLSFKLAKPRCCTPAAWTWGDTQPQCSLAIGMRATIALQPLNTFLRRTKLCTAIRDMLPYTTTGVDRQTRACCCKTRDNIVG
jgi:hypothetical protein